MSDYNPDYDTMQDGKDFECSHPNTRPATKDDQRPYCVRCLRIVA